MAREQRWQRWQGCMSMSPLCGVPRSRTVSCTNGSGRAKLLCAVRMTSDEPRASPRRSAGSAVVNCLNSSSSPLTRMPVLNSTCSMAIVAHALDTVCLENHRAELSGAGELTLAMPDSAPEPLASDSYLNRKMSPCMVGSGSQAAGSSAHSSSTCTEVAPYACSSSVNTAGSDSISHQDMVPICMHIFVARHWPNTTQYGRNFGSTNFVAVQSRCSTRMRSASLNLC